MTTTIGPSTSEANEGEESQGRCLVWRKCATCGEKTDHAYLRDLPSEQWCRDTAELSKRDRHENLRAEVRKGCGWDMGPYDPAIDS